MSELRKDDKYQALISIRDRLSPVRPAVVHPCDETPLGGAIDAAAAKIVKPILVGHEGRIPPRDEPLNLDITGLSIVPQPYNQAAEPMTSPAAGDADISVVRDLAASDMRATELASPANADAPGIVLGARVPTIITSGTDSVRTRMASCAIAALLAHARPRAAAAVGKIAG
jgi:phosphotransacetylase